LLEAFGDGGHGCLSKGFGSGEIQANNAFCAANDFSAIAPQRQRTSVITKAADPPFAWELESIAHRIRAGKGLAIIRGAVFVRIANERSLQAGEGGLIFGALRTCSLLL
jgi:hypothetical protein